MIAGATRGAGGAALGAHLAYAGPEQETRPGESRGLTSETIRDQIAELTGLGSHARTRQPLYHIHADPPEDRPWTAEERARFWHLTEQEFGLQDRPFASAIHIKEGREHEHRTYLRVRADGTAIRLDHDHARREKISRIVEFERGEPFTRGAHNRAVIAALQNERPEIAEAMRAAGLHDGPRPRASVTPKERAQQERTDTPKTAVARAVAAAWTASDSPHAFQAAIREAGMRLARGDRVALIVDQGGHSHSLTRLLGIAARAEGQPAPRAAEIAARMEGLALPPLDAARAEVRAAPPASTAAVTPPVPGPTAPAPPPGPGGGQTAPAAGSGDSAGAAAPAPSQGIGMPSPTAAPAVGGGGRGGGADTAADGAAAAILEDVGSGPGEPPEHGASPDEIARYRAKLAAYEERKGAAFLRYAKAQAAAGEQRNRGGGGHGNHGHADGGSPEQAKAIGEAVDRFFESVRRGAERNAARAEFARAIAAFQRGHESPGRSDQGGAAAPTPERGGGSPRVNGSGGHAAQDDHARRERGADPTTGIDRRDSADRGEPSQDRGEDRQDRGAAFRDRCAAARVETALVLTDLSGLRAAVAALTPDPLDGLYQRTRRETLREWKAEFLTLYQQDRAVGRDEVRAVWTERIAAEKLRAEPLAVALRTGWRHLSPDERAASWQAIRDARYALVERMKEEAKARPQFGFKEWLEGVAEHDPRAAAVYRDGVEKEQRKAARVAALDGEQRRIDAIRATAPKGERDPAKAIRAIKDEIKTEHAAREAAAAEATKAAAAARDAVRPWHHLPLMRGPLQAAEQAEARARDLALTAEIRAPGRETYRQAERDGTAIAERNQRAFAEWTQRHGKGLDRDEERLQSIREAVADRDREMIWALDSGGYAAAKALQDKRDGRGTSGSGMQAGPEMTNDQEAEQAHDWPAPRMR